MVLLSEKIALFKRSSLKMNEIFDNGKRVAGSLKEEVLSNARFRLDLQEMR